MNTCYRCEGRVLEGDAHGTWQECVMQLLRERDTLRALVRKLVLEAEARAHEGDA